MKCRGLFALLLGLLLLDKCFKAWRDDPRSFPDQNGHYLPGNNPITGRRLNNLEKRKVVTVSGMGLLIVSVLIFSRSGQRSNAPQA